MFDKLFQTYNFENTAEKGVLRSMFDMYMSDLPANFYLDQFALAQKYSGTEYLNWVKILRHSAFTTWKQEQIAIIASTVTDKALAGGEDVSGQNLNLLRIRQDVLESEKRIEKPTIIVLPESLFFKEDPT